MIIELLLSMVFKSSKNIAKLVLTALADHMTLKAFQLIVDVRYCKFRIFCENFIFGNSVIRPICHVKNLRIGHLPTSVKAIVIRPIFKGFIFRKLHFCEVL